MLRRVAAPLSEEGPLSRTNCGSTPPHPQKVPRCPVLVDIEPWAAFPPSGLRVRLTGDALNAARPNSGEANIAFLKSLP